MVETLAETTLVQRLVLLELVDARDDGPHHPAEVARRCDELVETADADVVGSVSETEVTRALNELAATDFVEERTGHETSPVGKGRPRYALDVDSDAVVSTFEDDDRLARLVTDLDD